jgi:VIT1/CCC1 family predicted Fe2+/Mn2+ transporter
MKALFISFGITAFVLLVFGTIKGYLTGCRCEWRWILASALQTLAIGTLAAGAAYGIVHTLDNDGAQ